MTQAGQPSAALLHGSGSDSVFVRASFAAPLARAGFRLLAPDDRTGAADLMIRRLDGLRQTTRLAIAGGVSVGAHAAARWAATSQSPELEGLILVMPAWTGAPGTAADLTAYTARSIRRHGVSFELQRLEREVGEQHDWVLDELQRSWPLQQQSLAESMERTAASRGPYLSELARIAVPVALVALRDDPLHPTVVAHEWATTLRHACVVELERHAPAQRREIIGEAALVALRKATRRRAPLV